MHPSTKIVTYTTLATRSISRSPLQSLWSIRVIVGRALPAVICKPANYIPQVRGMMVMIDDPFPPREPHTPCSEIKRLKLSTTGLINSPQLFSDHDHSTSYLPNVCQLIDTDERSPQVIPHGVLRLIRVAIDDCPQNPFMFFTGFMQTFRFESRERIDTNA